jgi:Ricin-type beta-trefoil lectin domain-like
MKNIVVRNIVLSAFALLAVILVGGGLSTVFAQGSEDRAIDQAQRAVRQRIVNREGGRNLTVLFNTDVQTDSKSRTEIRVRGTGSFSRNNDSRYSNSRDNDQRYNDSRNDGRMSRDFSYEAIVNNRSRYGSVSGVRYDLTSDRSGDGRDDNGRDNAGRDNAGRDNASRDNAGRDNASRDNASRDNAGRDNASRDNAGRDNASRDNASRDNSSRDNTDRENNRDGGVIGNRPNGRVSYSGPIMNRHSDKALDVTERSNQDGANIQQWSYADQPNQNWDVIDLGKGEAAIISRQSGRALTVQGGRTSNGANIIQQSWRGSPQQRWRLEQVGSDYYRIVSVDNGKCLDVTQQGRQDGATIQLWDYANQANQQWRLRR